MPYGWDQPAPATQPKTLTDYLGMFKKAVAPAGQALSTTGNRIGQSFAPFSQTATGLGNAVKNTPAYMFANSGAQVPRAPGSALFQTGNPQSINGVNQSSLGAAASMRNLNEGRNVGIGGALLGTSQNIATDSWAQNPKYALGPTGRPLNAPGKPLDIRKELNAFGAGTGSTGALLSMAGAGLDTTKINIRTDAGFQFAKDAWMAYLQNFPPKAPGGGADTGSGGGGRGYGYGGGGYGGGSKGSFYNDLLTWTIKR